MVRHVIHESQPCPLLLIAALPDGNRPQNPSLPSFISPYIHPLTASYHLSYCWLFCHCLKLLCFVPLGDLGKCVFLRESSALQIIVEGPCGFKLLL